MREIGISCFLLFLKKNRPRFEFNSFLSRCGCVCIFEVLPYSYHLHSYLQKCYDPRKHTDTQRKSVNLVFHRGKVSSWPDQYSNVTAGRSCRVVVENISKLRFDHALLFYTAKISEISQKKEHNFLGFSQSSTHTAYLTLLIVIAPHPRASSDLLLFLIKTTLVVP